MKKALLTLLCYFSLTAYAAGTDSTDVNSLVVWAKDGTTENAYYWTSCKYYDVFGVYSDRKAEAGAINGDAAQQNFWGLCYEAGYGVDYDEAAKWYRKAAEQGDAEAQYVLGNCYMNGEGVAFDEKEAVKWLHKAAEQGKREANDLLEVLEQ